jgi:hypothetical protein
MAPKCNLDQLAVSELLRLHAGVLDELRRREVVRSSNGPSGATPNCSFCERSVGNWRETPHLATMRQLSALRNLLKRPFDVLAAVLLDDNFAVLRAALIPIQVVIDKSTFTEHVNAHRFILNDAVWSIRDVIDVTEELKRAQDSV